MKTFRLLVFATLVLNAVGARASDVLRDVDRVFRPVESEKALDHVAPTPPVLLCTLVWRGWGSDGVEATAYSPTQQAFAQFVVEGASDDRTKPGELGYRFELAGGALPGGLAIPDEAHRVGASGDLYLKWDDGATWEQDPFYFRVTVRAVDKAGNESKPSNVVIVGNDGDMSYMKRQARLIYARAAAGAAEATAERQLFAPATSREAAGEKAAAARPDSISQVYKAATVRSLRKLKNVRVDRIAFQSRRFPDEAYELAQFTVTETGRTLTADELTQLTRFLLRPRSYTTDTWGGTFDTGFAFLSNEGEKPVFVIVNTASYQIGIGDNDARDAGNLSREAAAVLLGFCEGLFRIEPPTK